MCFQICCCRWNLLSHSRKPLSEAEFIHYCTVQYMNHSTNLIFPLGVIQVTRFIITSGIGVIQRIDVRSYVLKSLHKMLWKWLTNVSYIHVSDVNTSVPDKKSIMMYVMCLFQSLPHSTLEVSSLEFLQSDTSSSLASPATTFEVKSSLGTKLIILHFLHINKCLRMRTENQHT